MANSAQSNGVMLVTGANRGIGRAIAEAGTKIGYTVAVHYAQHRDEAESLVQSLRSMGGKAISIQADMAVESDILRLFKEIDEQLGTITALVNNAGSIVEVKPIAEISAATVERTLRVNLAGPILCCREALKRMSTARGGKGGAIVNISSMAAVLGGLPNEVHYAASKGGVDSLTIGLAREVATEGVRINAVRPGVIDTPIHDWHGGNAFLEKFAPQLPMKRAGTPQEIAEAVIWLLSPAASYVTGSILNVSGGR
ncbi:MAG: SDR family oxidoreductase [Beijerinckiaceae bacterium]|nr:SDR family oxidoreductase [Beijerinckiaceae bacterium]